MRSRRNNKRPRKHGRKTRSRRQKGGTIFTPRTTQELRDAVRRRTQNDREGLGNISDWDTSNITDMSQLFNFNWEFNEDISRWDVSNVIYMFCMFYEAEAFNQPIGSWNVSNVTTMGNMFTGATPFLTNP